MAVPVPWGPCPVWQGELWSADSSGGHWQQRVLSPARPLGEQRACFSWAGSRDSPCLPNAKFLMTGWANTSAAFWLLAGTALSYFCRAGHLHCLRVSLPCAFLADCSTPTQWGLLQGCLHLHSGTPRFFLQVHNTPCFSYFWGCPFLRKFRALCEERAFSTRSKWNHFPSHLLGSFSAFSWFQAQFKCQVTRRCKRRRYRPLVVVWLE